MVWVIAPFAPGYDHALFPTLRETFDELLRICAAGQCVTETTATLGRAAAGFALAAACGVLTGLAVGFHPRLMHGSIGTIDFFRSLPATAMFPLFLLAFGIGDGSKIAIAWFISFWVILVNAAYGAYYSAKTRTVLARLYKVGRFAIFRHIVFMEALPQVSMGLRTALPLSLIAVIVSEMFIGSSSGLGERIYDAYLTYEIAALYAWLIVTGAVGYGLNVLYTLLERRVLHWVGHA
jgi:NitT/TauT family transport system permease protein